MAKPAESVTIVIHPSGADVDSLTVADAMQQVLDTFALLSKAEVKDPSSGATVVWRLERASTNSPLTVEATAISSHPEIPVARQAIQAINTFREGIDDVLHARAKPAWMDGESQDTLKRLLARNLNGIGRTDFIVEDSPPTIIDHRSARRATNYLNVIAAEEALRFEDLTRKEYGSVEGNVTDATTWHGRPAFRIRARLSGRDVICVYPKGAGEYVGEDHKWSEVFKKQRVLVSGICHYNAQGDLTRIDVERIEEIKARNISISDLRDPDFTDGNSPSQHLRLVWGDEGND
jgi:hypothetical protein